jgi:hypothetical protein
LGEFSCRCGLVDLLFLVVDNRLVPCYKGIISNEPEDTMNANAKRVNESESVGGVTKTIIDAMADLKPRKDKADREWKALAAKAKAALPLGTHYTDLGNWATLFERSSSGLDKKKAKELIERATGSKKVILASFWAAIQTSSVQTTLKVFGNVTEDK